MSVFKFLKTPWPLFLTALAFACGAVGGDGEKASAEESPALAQAGGNPAPDFTLIDLNGQEVSHASLRGKVLIIDFWATWCPPCIKEVPEFSDLYRTYSDKGFVMLGISVDRGSAVVKDFVKKNNVPYPVVMGSSEVVNAYGPMPGIPTTFVINREGQIVEKAVGYRPKSFFEEHIKKLL